MNVNDPVVEEEGQGNATRAGESERERDYCSPISRNHNIIIPLLQMIPPSLLSKIGMLVLLLVAINDGTSPLPLRSFKSPVVGLSSRETKNENEERSLACSLDTPFERCERERER